MRRRNDVINLRGSFIQASPSSLIHQQFREPGTVPGVGSVGLTGQACFLPQCPLSLVGKREDSQSSPWKLWSVLSEKEAEAVMKTRWSEKARQGGGDR